MYCYLLLCCCTTAGFLKLRRAVQYAAKVCLVGRVCFVWGVEHGDAFSEGFQWYGKAFFGRKKKKRSRLKNWPILDPDLDWRDRPTKPSTHSRDFPRLQSFQGNSIPISITGIVNPLCDLTTAVVQPYSRKSYDQVWFGQPCCMVYLVRYFLFPLFGLD